MSIKGLAILALLVSGCALTDVTVQPPPPFQVAAGSQRGQGREVVVVRPFQDARPETRCGMKKNAYNSDTASVLCTRPASMIADLLAYHLSLAGFRVLRDRKAASPSAIVLTGALEQLFVEPKNNYFSVEIETDVGLKLWATTTSGLWAQRRFYVKGTEASMFVSDEDLQRSFDAGVRQLVISAVGAVADLAEHFPPSSSPAPQSAVPGPSPVVPSDPEVKVQETN